MSRRALWRLADIKQSIADIRTLLAGACAEDLKLDRAKRAAFERFLEILSEASRHVPEEWRRTHAPDIPWRRIADLGNHIRHAYHRLDAGILWQVYEEDLDPLEAAVDQMMTAYGSTGDDD